MKKIKKYFSILIMIIVLIGLTAPLDTFAASKVKINKTSSTLYVGNTVNLKISGIKAKVKWSTTNKKVATISNGKVTAKKAGTTTIKAKVGKDTYSCEVSVQNPSLNYSELSLNIGNSYTLKLSGTKAKSWKTSNKKIATINSKGKVVAKKLGSTTISVTGANGKTYKCKVTVQEVHNHSYNSSITKQPTCTENGVLTYTCACGDSYTETLSPTGHKSSDWIINSNPSCAINGSKHTVCTTCGVTLNTETMPAMGHIWNNGIITKAPTCLEEGVKTYTCSTCGITRTENISKIDHTWDSGIVNKVPTCLEEGIETYTCSICNTTKNESIAKIPHNFVMGAIIPPTCTEDGYTNYTCSVCGTTEQRDIIPALGHDYVDVVVAPTCTEQGYTSHTCSRCNDTYTDTIIKAKKHTYGNFVETLAPADFNTFGKANMVCPDCGEILYSDLTVVLLDLGNGNTTKVYGYYDRTEADNCFALTLNYKKLTVNTTRKYILTDESNIYSKVYSYDYIDGIKTFASFTTDTHTCPYCGVTTRYEFDIKSRPTSLGECGKADMICSSCNSAIYANLDVRYSKVTNADGTLTVHDYMFGYYNNEEEASAFILDNLNCITSYGYSWYEDKYNFVQIRVAENAYEFNDFMDISHNRLNGESLGCSENIACNYSGGTDINNSHFTSEEVFEAWLDSTGHQSNIAGADKQMSSAKFTAWMLDGGGWGVFWTQSFY